MFSNANKFSSKLKLANDATTDIVAKSDVHITAVGAENGMITLKDALCVPDLRTNLMSVATIADQKHEVTFKHNAL